MVFLASLLGESLSHSTEGEYSVDGFRTDTRCGWDCRITHSEFTNECGDSVFTKKRLVNFKVKFTLGIDTECSYQLRSYKLFGQYNVWIPANNTLSSFSHGIQSMWNMTFNSCFERGRIEGNCTLEPATTTALPSATGLQAVAEKTIEEKGYKLISKSWWQTTNVFFTFLLFVIKYCSLYLPALLCFFSPTLVMESGIRYIVLERASPVSIRVLLANNVFFNDCSVFASSWYQTAKRFIARLLFMALLILLVTPGILAFNLTSGISGVWKLSHPFLRVCVYLYIVKGAYTLLFSHVGASTEVNDHNCEACRLFTSNPGACLYVDVPQRLLRHLRIQPLIATKCCSCFFRGFQFYFEIVFSLWKGYRQLVIRVLLLLLILPTLPLITILLLLATLMTLFCGFCWTSPQFVALQHDWPLLSKLYGSSRFARLPALLKASLRFSDFCANCLALVGGSYLLLSSFLGVLLTLLLAFSMLLMFPEKSLPLAACFLLFCYYLLSNYRAFTDRYHDLSLTVFNCYEKQTDQTSHEEVDLNTTNNRSDNKHNGGVVKIPKELFDMACEELKPVRESLCLLVFKVVFIASFLFLVFCLTMQLDFGVKHLAKTMVAVFTGLFPKIVCKYFDGERQKRVEALIIKEKAPKIVESYLNSVLRANEGQENSGAETDEVKSLQVVESDEKVAILHI